MSHYRTDIKTFFLVSLMPLLFLLSGCYSAEQKKDSGEQYRGQFTLFLNGPDEPSLDITFVLSAVNVVSRDGVSRNVMEVPVEINSTALRGRQIILGERFLPEGAYKSLTLVVNRAFVRKKDVAADLALPSEGIEVPLDIFIKRQQNISIFMNWNSDASIEEGYLFRPVITVKSQVPELSSQLIYVTNEASDNVSVINNRSGEIIATIMVGRSPKGIDAVSKRERSRVYVANSGSNSISVIDPTINKVENEISIRFGSHPEGISVAEVSTERELIFVTNYKSNTVSVIDSMTFQETEKINAGQGPVAVAVDPPVSTLPNTGFLGFEDMNILKSYREKFFNVYVANRNSNNVSVIRMDKDTGKSIKVTNLKVEWNPVAVTVDYKRGKVFVANYGSDKLSVIDIVKLVKGEESAAVSTISDVGDFITGIISDPSFDRMYLLKEIPGEIVMIRPFRYMFESTESIMPTITGIIPVGISPRNFLLGPEKRRLYVVNSGSDNISVVDKTTKKVEQIIPVGKRPYGIAIFQN